MKRRYAPDLRATSLALKTYFQAADIISQVLTFGLPAPIDAQVSGPNLSSDYVLAVPFAVGDAADSRESSICRIAEPLNYPSFKVDVDRAKALEMGLTESDVASSLLTSTERQFPAGTEFLGRSETVSTIE